MTLKDCTKEELIFVIKRLQFYTLSDQYYVQRALNDVAMRREEQKHEEARRMSDIQFQKRQEYVDLLTPYEGKPIKDIPLDVIVRADAAMKESRAANKKWMKLMGILAGKKEKKSGQKAKNV